MTTPITSQNAKLPPLIPRARQKPPPAQSEPAPVTPDLPPPPSTFHFLKPTRRILSPQDHELFLSSPTYTLIVAFVFGVSDSVQSLPISAVKKKQQIDGVTKILEILDEAEVLLQAHPPLDTGSRFGNPAFRTYLTDIDSHLQAWHAKLGIQQDAVEEVSTYFAQSFGSSTRIDYGSGHELNFILWLLCLNRLGTLPRDSFPQLALIVFPRYLRLMRAVQSAYYLEPAGSHGVWGLDDYQFLPFLFGASQLVGHKFITPKAIHSALTLEECAPDFLYLDQVAFINSVKNVEGLRWHSPMLDDISAAKSWDKIEAGLKKMFVKEVLGKLPVMQHFLFGSLIPAVDGMSREEDGAPNGNSEHNHDHNHDATSWGDCCGIQVPGALGAAQEMKKRAGEGLRRLPFD